jgi:RNA polymerase sigma-70 factor (ECF subfamily)
VLPCNLETTAAQNQLLGRVKAILSGMPDGQREAIELAYFEGMTHSEIAEHLATPLGTVKTRIRSAVEILKQALA